MKKKILVQSNGQLYNVTFKNIILLVFHATELVLYVRNPKDDTVEKLPVTRKVHWRSELESASDFERVHKKHLLNLSYLWKVTHERIAILTVVIDERVVLSKRCLRKLLGLKSGSKAENGAEGKPLDRTAGMAD